MLSASIDNRNEDDFFLDKNESTPTAGVDSEDVMIIPDEEADFDETMGSNFITHLN
jgi:hypothetical protein